jgi:predicted nucleic acid-binding protein
MRKTCPQARPNHARNYSFNLRFDPLYGVESVLDTIALLDQRLPGNDMLVVPSVLDELAFLCDSGGTDGVRQSALQAVKLVREQDRFRPLLELAHPPALIEEVAREIRSRGLLPRHEVHDSLILAEAALLGCGLLLTSDEHLRGVDHEHLTLVLNPFELVPPVIASPREIVRKFLR